MSVRQAALGSKLSKSTADRIVSNHKFYSIRVVHSLTSERLTAEALREFLMIWSQENNLLLDNIIWTDKARFTKNGVLL